MVSNNPKEKSWIYFCPCCHNMRIKDAENEFVAQNCNKCGTRMITVCSKEEFNIKKVEEKKKLISDLKADYSDVATPTEIMLKRISENSEKMENSLNTIKNILLFYFTITIIGFVLVFFGLVMR